MSIKFPSVLIFVFMALSQLSCSNRKDNNAINVDVNSDASREIAPRIVVSEVIPLVGDMPLGEIHKAIIRNDHYYLFSKNDKTITCYDQEGNYVFQIAAQGHGPQEYVGLTNFFIDETDGELKVLSLDGDLVSFSPVDGTFIRRESTGHLMLNDATTIDDHSVAFSIMGPEWNLEIRQDGDSLPVCLLPFNELRDFVISKKIFARHGNEIYHSYGQDNNIYSLEHDSVRVAYRIDFGLNGIAPELYTEGGSEESRIAALERRFTENDIASKIDDLNVSKEYLSFSYLYFPMSGEISSARNVIYNRQTGRAYNFPHDDFYLLPAAGVLPNEAFVSVVAPVRIFSEEAVEIADVNRAMQARSVKEEDNPVVILWKLIL